ncbi:TonB-dependent receptor domain-containing protein [Coralloluteibacterium stylophorae]|uniref:TonB-dependent receptor n=1 Tax=Coralloluteibacterium stylophorae TaxID=1776034 RepID=A0AAP2C9U1_9GAMM|nr:TonB-dependent receptor [Coralloluteibacterium stylophorae]MBS7456070.1 TonB-dependent receptor [Coralloluteibacterium stylophorae]
MTFKTKPLSNAIKVAMFAGTGLAMTAPAVLAQSSEATTLDRIQVTGSRIQRVDVETSQPVFSLSREDVQSQGLTSIGDVIQNLSTGGSALNSTFNNGGNGETRVSLRNLGSDRTLVLVNGRRWIGGTGLGGAVDLNTIPTAAVERIDVLKDGASVIYGSDAIAGVINIVLRTDFDGAEANAYFGQFDKGDGNREAYDFTIGSVGDRWTATFGVGYVKENPVMAGDREISAEPTFGTGNAFGSSTTPDGRFGFGDSACFTGRFDDDGNPINVAAGNQFPGATDGASCVPGTLTTDGPGSPARPFGGADIYNFAPENYLLTPQERRSIFGNASLDVTDNVRFKATAIYNERESEQLLAAMPVTLGTVGSGNGAGVVWSADNAYNPFGEDVTRIQRRFTESGGRRFMQDVNTTAITLGFEGDFEVGDRYFAWDAGYFWGENEQSDTTDGLFTFTALGNALGPTFVDADGNLQCGTAANPVGGGCVPLDLYGYGSLTQEMLDYVGFEAHDNYGYQNKYWYASLSGDVFELPAGPLQFSLGAERRKESGYDHPDALINAGDTTGNARTATDGGYDVDEAYLELQIPLLADLPGAQLLDLNIATRYSDYSTFGDTQNSKAGFRWKPINDLMVRGNYTEGFRAPSISELFQGQSDSFPTINDPCSTASFGSLSAEGQARCVASGVPQGGYVAPNQQQRITVGGNPNVQPELSTSKTLGFVYSPSYIQGFDISLDWWNIELENTITTFSGNAILNSCFVDGLTNFCSLITRKPDGSIEDLLSVQNNIGSTEVEGYDLTLNYRLPETAYGTFSFTLDSAYISKYEEDLDGDGVRGEVSEGGNQVGEYGPIWRLRSTLATRWEYADFGATWNVRFYSGLDEDCQSYVDYGYSFLCSDPDRIVDDEDGTPIAAAENHIGATTYHDVSGYWKTPWNGRITLGVNNVLEKEPPRSVATFANSFDPEYDVPGRFYYARYTQRF